MRTRLFLPVVAMMIVLLCGAVYVLPQRDAHPAPTYVEPTPAPALNIAGIDGAALYERLCDKCHGLREANYGPALTSLSNASDEAIRTIIQKGVPETAMGKPEEALSPEQLAALVKFVKENALPKSPADAKALAIGLNAAATQMDLTLVPVEGGDLVARATLKDDKGTPLAGKPVVFNRVSSLGGRLPFGTVTSTAQGLAVAYYPIKPGDSVRMEAAFEGERGRQASTAILPLTATVT